MKKKFVLMLLSLFPLIICGKDLNKRKVEYVNPFIGASTNTKDARSYHGLGKTIPGATYPFGMVQVSPNTITGGDNGSGYSYEHQSIEGFAFTQMSGIGWYGDLGNFLVMPTVGKLHTNSGHLDNPDLGYRSRYLKESEYAEAGYYRVLLSDYNIKAEMTVAQHSGFLKFMFPKSKQSRIQIDLARRVGGTSTWQEIRVIDDSTIMGKIICTPEGGGWGNGAGKADYTLYFYAQFSKPLKNYGVWSVNIPDKMSRKRNVIESEMFQKMVSNAEIHRNVESFSGKHIGFFTEFETKQNEIVLMKAGISFVSEEGAKKNLESEIYHWNFDLTLDECQKMWEQVLSKINVKIDDEDKKTVFYTALYRTMLDPRLYSDVDGKYIGGDKMVHDTKSFNKRTIFSGWDVFRSQMPLLTIIRPDVVHDILNSLITLAEESGKNYFERWEFLNSYSGCMVGNPAISVLVDAYKKGIKDFDINKAWHIADLTSKKFGNAPYGYVPNSISETLEYAYTEWCMSEFAKLLGKSDEERKYVELSLSYKNIFDSSKNSFCPKDNSGCFLSWPENGRLTEGFGCVESNPFQQGWFVPHDIEGLIQLKGGKIKTIEDLDYMFENTPSDFLWNKFYNHANEPVHHIPFLYNRLGEPWKTQYWSNSICRKAYKNDVKGLVGNEDVGQMSAWYVLSSIGIHPICPGDMRYELTTPIFDEIDIDVGSSVYFRIKVSKESSGSIYIHSAKLNGKLYNLCHLDYSDIMRGGVLESFLGDKPNTDWGI